jgi:hypothetical protein
VKNGIKHVKLNTDIPTKIVGCEKWLLAHHVKRSNQLIIVAMIDTGQHSPRLFISSNVMAKREIKR